MFASRDLRDAVVVVTGASSGVGRAAAEDFARLGSHVVLAARSAGPLEEAAASCRAHGPAALAVPTDVRDAAQVEALRDRAVEAFGRIDIWVDVAGTLVAGPLQDAPPDELSEIVATNVLGPMFGSRMALETFRRQGHGTLINVSSLLGLIPNPVVPAYVATKFAVRGLSLSLRQFVAGDADIHVCVVMPGPIDTPMFQRAANHTGHELRAIAPAMSAERVAAGIVSCAKRPRRQMTIGVLPHVMLIGHHVVPRFVEWSAGQVAARLVTRPDPAAPQEGAVLGPVDVHAVSGRWRLGRARRALGDRLGRAAASRPW